MSNLRTLLDELLNGRDLLAHEMHTLMSAIMQGELDDIETTAWLIGLRAKGESIVELTAAAKVMRSLSTKVEVADCLSLVDTCGTGGDHAGLFNISTASAFVAAAAGARIAKHGNRSNSSASGSSDVLEAAGVNLAISPEKVAESIEKLGIGFIFAPSHHSAMRHVAHVRKTLAIRTIFNLLGPLTNPAGACNQVLGVFDDKWLMPLAKVLRALGSNHVLVVHSADGLDEISCADSTHIAELNNGDILEHTINPSEYGLEIHSLDKLKVSNAQESCAIIEKAFSNNHPAAETIIALNAGAAIYTGTDCRNLQQGIAQAQEALQSGAALEKWKAYAAFTQKN